MRSLVVVFALLTGGVAAADPSLHCPEGDKLDTAVFVGEAGPIVCVGKTPACVVATTGEVTPHPRATEPDTEVRMEGGALAACAGKKCRKLGKKLRASLSAKVSVQLSRDLGIAVLTQDGRSSIWDVARDRKLAPNPGKELASAPMRAELVGSAIVATWNPCGGPCAVARLVDRAGRVRGPVFGGGKSFDVDGRRIVVATEDADRSELVVLDTKTFKLLGSLRLGDAGMQNTAIAKLDADHVLVLVGSTLDRDFQLATVTIKGKPKLDATTKIDCTE